MQTKRLVTFGKYRGRPVEFLLADRTYCTWLLSKPDIGRMLQKTYPELYPLIVSHASTLEERIEDVVDKCPIAVSGEHGHTKTFLVAISLVRGFNLSQQAALPFLRRYSARCSPPWSEPELRHKLKQADNLKQRKGKAPLKPRGYLL
jgi:hypothetical protein